MKKVAAFAAVVLIIITLGVFVIQQEVMQKDVAHTSHFVMGSILEQSLWGKLGEVCAGEVFAAMEALEDELNAMTEAPAIALEVSEASGGAFSPYLGAVTALWNIDSKDGTPPHVPSQEEIAQALQEKVLDLGAYGKGAACDAALRKLMASVNGAFINLGGNIMTYKQKRLGQPFKIALRDPKGGVNDALGMFKLKGIHFISTSGSYEKYFEQDGKRYHHIFDPKTGCPAETGGLISVTVITHNPGTENGGALGDMLSTACFVLGYDDSRELLLQYNADAIFVYESGEVRTVGRVLVADSVRAASGVRNYFEITNPNYHWSDE